MTPEEFTEEEIKRCEEVWQRWYGAPIDPTYGYLLVVELKKALFEVAISRKEFIPIDRFEREHARGVISDKAMGFLFSKLAKR